jgi:hypothetical protein
MAATALAKRKEPAMGDKSPKNKEKKKPKKDKAAKAGKK